MNSFGNSGGDSRRSISILARIAPVVTGLAAIAVTFAAATFGAGRLAAFVLTASSALVFLVVSVAVRPRPIVVHEFVEVSPEPESEQMLDAVDAMDAIEERLVALDEAREVFGSSLSAVDMFRLVASRVGDIYPFAACVLAVPDESGTLLKFVHSDGVNSEALRGLEAGVPESLAGRSFGTGKIVTQNAPMTDEKLMGAELLAGFRSSAAIPLTHGEKPFGVFQLYLFDEIRRDDDTIKLLEAIGEHVTPIFRSSLAFERTLSSALTDTLTGLPNERAFYMVLESQLAESLRHRDERPLTILSIDIRDFGAVNSMLGHAVGDQMLEFVGEHIGEHLRKMDFLARTVNDEFSVILPTANEKTAFEIIGRIKAGFEQQEFEISDGEGVVIALNIGWATFWKDGETVEQLIRAAQQRKRQAKSEIPADVLWFPKEYVN